MASFWTAVTYVIQNEGTTYTDNPNDSGGPTKYGITQNDLARWRKKPVSPDDVKNLTEDEAQQIYQAFYWLPMGCDLLNDQAIATAIMDCGVLDGIVTSVRWAQEIVKVSADGHMGPVSEAALNATDGKAFITGLVSLLTQHYQDIVAANPKDHEFLAGWLARSKRLYTLIS